MIGKKSFKHKGLRKFWENGSTAGIVVKHAERLKDILAMLHAAKGPEGMSVAGWNLHLLEPKAMGRWAVKVNASWRVTFRFDGQNAFDVNYEDYH